MGSNQEDDFFKPSIDDPPTEELLRRFVKLAIPSIFTNFIGFLTNLIAVIFAGRFDYSISVAVMGLAGTSTRICMMSILVGINAAQETLTSQAFGAGNLRLCGVYLNRGSLILSLLFILLAMIPAFFAEEIFLAIKLNDRVSYMTAHIIRLQLPHLFLFAHLDLW